MKFLKTLLIILLALIALVMLVAAFLPSTVVVSRSVEINKPVEEVFAYVSRYRERQQWDPWLEQDPGAKVTISDPDSGVGSSYAWDGEVIGSGNMVIEALEANKSVTAKLNFVNPQPMSADVMWDLKATANGTRATWSFSSSLHYPIGRIMGLFMDQLLGPDFEKGLANLKELIESK